jgi:hypothetical protein
MVALIQLVLLAIVFALRRSSLLGRDLKPISSDSDTTKLEAVYRSKNSIISRKIGFAHSQNLTFVVRKEKWHHRFLKFLGLASEISLPDEALNRALFVLTDYPNQLEHAMRSDALLAAIRELFQMNIKALHVVHDRVWCSIGSQDRNKGSEFFDHHRELLKKIAQYAQMPSHLSEEKPAIRRQSLALIFISFHMALLLTGLFGVLPQLMDDFEVVKTSEWFVKSANYIVPVIFLWTSLITLCFGGSSWLGWVLADFVLSGIVGLVLFGLLAVREANIHFDTSQAQIIETPIQQRYCELTCSTGSGKRRRSRTYTLSEMMCESASRPSVMAEYRQRDYYCQSSARFSFHLKVAHWRTDATAPFYLAVQQAFYDQTRVGAKLAIPSHSGALGIEWIDRESVTLLAN